LQLPVHIVFVLTPLFATSAANKKEEDKNMHNIKQLNRMHIKSELHNEICS